MSENQKIIDELSEKATSDQVLLRGLVADPEATVKNAYSRLNLTDTQAKDIAKKVLEFVMTIPGTEITSIFRQMIHYSVKAFKRTSLLNQVVFWTGIILIAITLIFELSGRITGNETWQNVATTGIIGAIGVGTIVSSFIFRPLSAIQNSLGNLSQIEVAFLTFVDRRDVIIAIEKPRDIDAAMRISQEFKKIASETMELVQKYCEESPKGESIK